MKLLSRINLILLVLFMASVSAYGDDGSNPPPPPPPEEEVLPIDGGVFVMLGISILLGLYKLYQYKQQKKIPA